MSNLGFASEEIQQTLNPTQIDLEERVRKTSGVMLHCTDGLVGYEFGQTKVRKIFIRSFDKREESENAGL